MAGTARDLLGALVDVLDDVHLGMRGVRLTTLTKVLHRKRPLFVPLSDRYVKACYVGSGPRHPVAYRKRIDTVTYYFDVAAAISADLDTQTDTFTELREAAPGVAPLRVLDVLAWRAGKVAAARG